MNTYKDQSNDVSKVLPLNAPDIHHQLLAQWEQRRVDGIPYLKEFDFEAFLSLSHAPFLIERIKVGSKSNRFIYRNVSPKLDSVFQRKHKDLDIEDLLGKSEYTFTAKAYQRSVDTVTPHYFEKWRTLYGRTPIHFHSLVLPLSEDSVSANWLFGSTIFVQNRS